MIDVEEEREILTEEEAVLDIRMEKDIAGYLGTVVAFLLTGPVLGVIADNKRVSKLQKRILKSKHIGYFN